MATKSTWKIETTTGANSLYWYWKLSNLITGDIVTIPLLNTYSFELQVNSNTDYNFIWNRNQLNQIVMNVLDIKLINGGTPAYNNSSTDFASIIALM